MDDDRAEVAAELTRLAKLPEFEGRAEDLRSLADELVADKGLTWAGINLLAAFPAAATGEPRRSHWVERWLSYVATAVIFAPIAWTWFSFQAASTAYRDALNQGTVGQATFLSLWATGFDGDLRWYHRLVVVATISLVIIIAAALLVVLQRRVVYKNQKTETSTYARLVTALVGAQRILNQRITENPNDLMGWIHSRAEDLIEAHVKTQAAAADLQAATNALTTAVTDTLKPVLTSLKTVAQSLAGAAETTATASGTLSQTAAYTQAEVKTTLNEFSASLTETQRAFATQVTEGLTGFRTEATQLIEEGEKSHTAFVARAEHASSTVADAVTKLGIEHAGLTAAVKALPGQSEAAAKPLTDAVATFTTSVEQWRSTVSAHDDKLDAYAAAAQVQTSEFTDATDNTQRVLHDFIDRYRTLSGNGANGHDSP